MEEVTQKKKRGRPSKAEQALRREEHIQANWGGSREGAGRKSRRSVEGEKLSATIAFCVTPTFKKKYLALKARGVDPISPMVDAVEQLAALLGIKVED